MAGTVDAGSTIPMFGENSVFHLREFLIYQFQAIHPLGFNSHAYSTNSPGIDCSSSDSEK